MRESTRRTQIMGILNVTPDSFYSGSRVPASDDAVARGLRIAEEGADWLDIGGESTSHFRNGSKKEVAPTVSAQEEIDRVLPVIERLHTQCNVRLSIDTMKPEVARAAVAAGASMINDISGFRSEQMQQVAAETNALLCVMHMRGTPVTMQQDTKYPGGLIPHLLNWARERTAELEERGVKPDRILLDPGLCFGKSLEGNYEILAELNQFKLLGYPLLIGLSRKSMMGRFLDKPASELLEPTIALNTVAVLNGASVLRVHDVGPHRDALDVIDLYQNLKRQPCLA